MSVQGPQAVPDSHKPTANERNNLVHLCFTQLLGISFRVADLSIIETLAPDVQDLNDLRQRYVPVIAEYLWDHFMGEPEEPTQQQVEHACLTIANILYTMDEETRNDIEAK